MGGWSAHLLDSPRTSEPGATESEMTTASFEKCMFSTVDALGNRNDTLFKNTIPYIPRNCFLQK